MTSPSTHTCEWPSGDEMMIRYHDEEWGVPVHDDRKLFEFIILDAFQAGLSWKIVLRKRENFRRAFDNFDALKIISYDEKKLEELIADASIIRNKAKIFATVQNARAFLKVQEEFGSFDAYIWQFTEGKQKVNAFEKLTDIPAKSPESDAMSRDLMKRGFKFVGSTICYAFMQAAGMVNDHVVGCYRHKECQMP